MCGTPTRQGTQDFIHTSEGEFAALDRKRLVNFGTTLDSRRRSLEKIGWSKSREELTSGQPSLAAAKALYEQVKSERTRRMARHPEAPPLGGVDAAAAATGADPAAKRVTVARREVFVVDPIVAAQVEAEMRSLELRVRKYRVPGGGSLPGCVRRALKEIAVAQVSAAPQYAMDTALRRLNLPDMARIHAAMAKLQRKFRAHKKGGPTQIVEGLRTHASCCSAATGMWRRRMIQIDIAIANERARSSFSVRCRIFLVGPATRVTGRVPSIPRH